MRSKSYGVLLQSIPYLGKSRILKIFTEDAGMITLMAKKTSLSPFCIAEWVYHRKKSEIFSLIEESLVNGLLELRQSYAALTAAGSIARDLLRTQLPSKNAPALYSLLSTYLKRIFYFEDPDVLAASFRLKLLLHEGLLALQSQCAFCERGAGAFLEGASVCLIHASFQAIRFSIPEWQILHNLVFARQFSLLQQMSCSPALKEKIASLFEERLTD